MRVVAAFALLLQAAAFAVILGLALVGCPGVHEVRCVQAKEIDIARLILACESLPEGKDPNWVHTCNTIAIQYHCPNGLDSMVEVRR